MASVKANSEVPETKGILKCKISEGRCEKNHVGDDENVVSPSRTKRLWKKVRYQLMEYHALPEYLRDNEYILGYYRSEWPLKQVFLSMFTLHNETLNVWTHLVGFFLFLCLTIYTVTKLPRVVDFASMPHLPHVLNRADLQKLQVDIMTSLPSLPNRADLQRLQAELRTALPSMGSLPSLPHWHLPELLANCLPESLLHANHTEQCVLQTMRQDVANVIALYLQRPITRWPFFVFLGGAMFCLLASSTCHLLSCHSERFSYIMLRLDYIGIAALIATSFYPPVYYSFMCNLFFRDMYLIIITLLGITTILVSMLPIFQNPKFRTFRASLFFGMGISGVAPIIHKLVLHKSDHVALHTTAYEIAMGAFYGIGALWAAGVYCDKYSCLADTTPNEGASNQGFLSTSQRVEGCSGNRHYFRQDNTPSCCLLA